MMCEQLSRSHICLSCQEEYLQPSFYKRTIASNVLVYSFYKYSDIEHLLHTKHTPLGFYMYSILANLAFKKFADNFDFDTTVASLSIDDHTRSGYSHTALLNKALQSRCIRPYYAKMRAKNSVTYSGKNYEFRRNNPRDFIYKPSHHHDVILVDDIITTGATLSEAAHCITVQGKHLLFCLTLANAEL